jgi:hypothetical protein
MRREEEQSEEEEEEEERVHDDADDAEALNSIGIPNIYKICRALKKDDHGAYNCLASIVQDTAFVRRVTR